MAGGACRRGDADPTSATNRFAMKTKRSSAVLRRMLMFAVVVLVALGAAACGNKGGKNNAGASAGTTGDPVQGDWLIIHALSDPEDLNLLIVTDSLDEVHKVLVDCYNNRCWDAWKRSEGARLDADPPGAPATAPDPRKAGAE